MACGAVKCPRGFWEDVECLKLELEYETSLRGVMMDAGCPFEEMIAELSASLRQRGVAGQGPKDALTPLDAIRREVDVCRDLVSADTMASQHCPVKTSETKVCSAGDTGADCGQLQEQAAALAQERECVRLLFVRMEHLHAELEAAHGAVQQDRDNLEAAWGQLAQQAKELVRPQNGSEQEALQKQSDRAAKELQRKQEELRTMQAAFEAERAAFRQETETMLQMLKMAEDASTRRTETLAASNAKLSEYLQQESTRLKDGKQELVSAQQAFQVQQEQHFKEADALVKKQQELKGLQEGLEEASASLKEREQRLCAAQQELERQREEHVGTVSELQKQVQELQAIRMAFDTERAEAARALAWAEKECDVHRTAHEQLLQKEEEWEKERHATAKQKEKLDALQRDLDYACTDLTNYVQSVKRSEANLREEQRLWLLKEAWERTPLQSGSSCVDSGLVDRSKILQDCIKQVCCVLPGCTQSLCRTNGEHMAQCACVGPSKAAGKGSGSPQKVLTVCVWYTVRVPADTHLGLCRHCHPVVLPFSQA